MIGSHPLLVVEDSEDDLYILKRSLKIVGISNEIRYVTDGQQAMDYLEGTGQYFDRIAFPIPSLILLDLKLPGRHGFDVLTNARKAAPFRKIVIVVLTSSSEIKDVEMAYDLGANAFLVKPSSTEKLTELLRAVDLFWLRHNRFPRLEL